MNDDRPAFEFALSPGAEPISPQSDLWSTPLPVSRHAFGPSQDPAGSQGAPTHGDYFTAVQHFLSRDHYGPLCEVAGLITGGEVTLADLEQVGVYLVKHGAFYHPAYVLVGLGSRQLALVLNVAVSAEGREMIAGEYEYLSRLNAERSVPFWPQVLGAGQGLDLRGRAIPMFLGQWLEGFHEFHLSGSGQPRVVVWDTEGGHRRLNSDQVLDCMRQAAAILTYAYNPLTFEAIRNWHHAAGDFVVSLDGDAITVRLITVRRYAPMVDNAGPDVADMLDALLLFLTEISLKLRIDRLDGVGAMVLHDDAIVPAICRGFFEGLQMSSSLHGLPEDFGATVKEFAALHDRDQLKSIASAVIENYPQGSDERDMLRGNLDHHISAFLYAISD